MTIITYLMEAPALASALIGHTRRYQKLLREVRGLLVWESQRQVLVLDYTLVGYPDECFLFQNISEHFALEAS